MTKSIRIIIIIAVAVTALPVRLVGQSVFYTDPTRLAAYHDYVKRENSTLSGYIAAQAALIAAEKNVNQELASLNDYRTELDNYMKKVHDVITIAANVYGLFYEVSDLYKNYKSLAIAIAENSDNLVAVALSRQQSHTIEEMVTEMAGLVGDIRTVLSKKKRMTEKERLQMLSNIRPKLKRLNIKLVRIEKMVRYYSFVQLWDELDARRHRFDRQSRRELILQRHRLWCDASKTNKDLWNHLTD